MGPPNDDGSIPPPATLSGRTVAGRYQVIGLLGQGGIGRVYSAMQVGLDRKCAVKVIRPERRADPVTAQRFMREARAAGRISSPHVVTLFDFGKDGNELYIAMELLEGQSLSQRLKRGEPMELAEAVSTAASIAQGLRAAHEAGVLHRDLKPANVFLCDDGVVKVLDFGIAKLIDDANDWEPLTAVNRILGTPVYMSPEAATRRPLGPTADLYALGLLIYEMIVGEPPFKTGNAMKTLQAQVSEPAPRLRQAAPWVSVPEALDDLVERLLQKDPADRPRDAGEVTEALDRIATRLRLGTTSKEQPLTTSVGPTPRHEPAFQGGDADATEVWSGRPWETLKAPTTEDAPAIDSMDAPTDPSSPLGAAPTPLPEPVDPQHDTMPTNPDQLAALRSSLGAPPPEAPQPGAPQQPPPATPATGPAKISTRQLIFVTMVAGLLAFGAMLLLRVIFG